MADLLPIRFLYIIIGGCDNNTGNNISTQLVTYKQANKSGQKHNTWFGSISLSTVCTILLSKSNDTACTATKCWHLFVFIYFSYEYCAMQH